MPSDIEAITQGFPFPTITKIQGRPTFEDIKNVHKKLAANVSSVLTTLGGGNHGYLGLVVSAAAYQRLTGAALVTPFNPGQTPLIPAGVTAAQMAGIRDTHKE